MTLTKARLSNGIKRVLRRTSGSFSYGTRDIVEMAYRIVLNRPADPGGLASFTHALKSGRLSIDDLVRTLALSDENKRRRQAEELALKEKPVGQLLLEALHGVRVNVIIGLPKAKRILDLGGSCAGWPEGALVVFGYPYSFERLTIVDLPGEDRHTYYTDANYQGVVPTKRGPVDYVYSSLADLSALPDESYDLVYSGQSIEHVTQDEARQACREVYRVLKPDGHFCLDTPNRAVTKIECPDQWINADHKYEYTHPEMASLIGESGFDITEAKGLMLYADSLEQGKIDYLEGMRNAHIYDDIERCYLLYYRCRKRK